MQKQRIILAVLYTIITGAPMSSLGKEGMDGSKIDACTSANKRSNPKQSNCFIVNSDHLEREVEDCIISH